MTSNITPENYVFKFGKFNKMRAVDVAQIYEVEVMIYLKAFST